MMCWCRGRALQEHGASWVLWAGAVVLAAQEHHAGPHSQQEEQGTGWPAQSFQIAVSSCPLLEETAREELGGGVGEASMVIRMNCLELLITRNELLSNAWGKWFVEKVMVCETEGGRGCVCWQKVYSCTVAQQAEHWGCLEEEMQHFPLWIITFIIYSFIVHYLMDSGTFRFWVCREGHLEAVSSLLCP